MAESIGSLLRNAAMGDKGIIFVALDGSESFLSYRDLLKAANRVLVHLNASGLRARDHLILQIAQSRDFLCALWACFLGGIIPVPATPFDLAQGEGREVLRLKNISHILGHPKAMVSLGPEDLPANLPISREQIIPFRLAPSDGSCAPVTTDLGEDAFIQFSSGSTGDPKGVVLTQGNILANLSSIIESARLGSNDVFLSWMPYYHDMGLFGFHLVPLALGILQINLQPVHFIKTPRIWLEKISQHRATVTGTPNFGISRTIAHVTPDRLRGVDLSSLRLIFNGAEPISADVVFRFLDQIAPLGLARNTMYPVFGLAEATLAVSFPTPGEPLKVHSLDRDSLTVGSHIVEAGPHSVRSVKVVDLGFPVSGCQVQVRNAEGQAIPEEIVGHIWIKGRNVMRGYFQSSLGTGKQIDDWVDTGDIGFLRERRLSITGRSKDILFVRGQNYYSNDIESIAEELGLNKPGRVAAIGIPDPETMEDRIVVLFDPKAAKRDQWAADIDRLCRHLNYSLGFPVSEILPLPSDAFKKTTSGKLRRFELRQAFDKGDFEEIRRWVKGLCGEKAKAGPVRDEPPSEEFLWVVSCWSDLLKTPCEVIHARSRFTELGGDSVRMLELLVRVEAKLRQQIQPRDLIKIRDAGELAEYLKAHGGVL